MEYNWINVFNLLVGIPELKTQNIHTLHIYILRLKTLEWDILNPDLLTNLEIKFMRSASNI